MQSTPADAELPWWFFPATGLNATIAAVWAFDAVACEGLVAGALSMLITLCVYALVRLDVMAAVLLVFASSAGVAIGLAKLPVFAPRKELLFMLLPLAAFAASAAIARWLPVTIECSLGPWR